MKNIKANRHFSRCLVLDPSRQDRKIVDSNVKNQAKQTYKPNAPTLPCLAQLSLIHAKSLQNTLSHPNPINPPHAPIGSFEKAILMSRI